jgi:Fe(3+) dicitrate transport protein
VRSSGFKQLDGGGDTGFARTELMAKARHRISLGGAQHTFLAKLGFSAEESNETYLGLTDADFQSNPLRRYASSALDHMSNHRESLALTHRLDVGEVTLTTTAYGNFFSRVWRRLDLVGGTPPGPVLANPQSPRNMIFYGVLTGELGSSGRDDQLVLATNDRRFLSAGVQTVLRAPFATGPVQHALEVQARYHYDLASRRHIGERFDMRGGALVNANETPIDLLSNLDDTKALALAAIDAMRLGPVTLTPGLRFELIRSRSNDKLLDTLTHGAVNALLPGVGAHWAILPELGVLAGVYRGFTPPAPGQADAEPEFSVNYEAGARWARRGERLEVIGYFNDYSNLTNICTQSSGCSAANVDMQFNAGRARIYGLELYGEKTFRFSKVVVPLSLAYTLAQTELLDTFSSGDAQLGKVTAGDELPYVPRHQLNLSAGVDVWRVSAHAQLNFIDRMREVAGQGDEGPLTDPQLTVDVHLGFRVFDWLSLYADARNIADNRAIIARRPFGARPNAPRTLIAGLKLSY